MSGISGIVGGPHSVANGYAATKAAKVENEMSNFQSLVDSVNKQTLSSTNVVEDGHLQGDYRSNFSDAFTTEADKKATPVGAAANSASVSSKKGSIDKTSKLYEKALELESYFVKNMLSSMRDTLSTKGINGEEKSYAQNMYEDMLYDEMAINMTKEAGFGLADQIYQELV